MIVSQLIEELQKLPPYYPVEVLVERHQIMVMADDPEATLQGLSVYNVEAGQGFDFRGPVVQVFLEP